MPTKLQCKYWIGRCFGDITEWVPFKLLLRDPILDVITFKWPLRLLQKEKREWRVVCGCMGDFYEPYLEVAYITFLVSSHRVPSKCKELGECNLALCPGPKKKRGKNLISSLENLSLWNTQQRNSTGIVWIYIPRMMMWKCRSSLLLFFLNKTYYNILRGQTECLVVLYRLLEIYIVVNIQLCIIIIIIW